MSTSQDFELQTKSTILSQLRSQELWVINKTRRNGLIIYKQYYAEFAGPGAIIGSAFDLDVIDVLPVGNLLLEQPETPADCVQAYLIRRQWVRLIKQIVDNPIPRERAQVILNQFQYYFDAETVEQIPDEAFALLIGVLPQTVRQMRR